MVVFPKAKINIGLYVTEKREDGFHNLETLFYPVNLCDILEVVPTGKGSSKFTSTGRAIGGDPNDNLCLKAYGLLGRDFELPNVLIHLHKIIPIGAGLGGGSSDASNMLLALNQLFDLKISIPDLQNYASQLGSDCPFFVESCPVIASGRGELMSPVSLDISGYTCTIVYPEINISTRKAFQNLQPKKSGKDLMELVSQPMKNWKDKITNDFEDGLVMTYPIIGQIKEELYKCNADFVLLSGSGSSVFALSEGPLILTGFLKKMNPENVVLTCQ